MSRQPHNILHTFTTNSSQIQLQSLTDDHAAVGARILKRGHPFMSYSSRAEESSEHHAWWLRRTAHGAIIIVTITEDEHSKHATRCS